MWVIDHQQDAHMPAMCILQRVAKMGAIVTTIVMDYATEHTTVTGIVVVLTVTLDIMKNNLQRKTATTIKLPRAEHIV